MNRRIHPLAATLILAAAVALAVNPASGQGPGQEEDPGLSPRRLWERVELSLNGGLGLSLFKWTTIHSADPVFPGGIQTSARNKISAKAPEDIFVGGAATFYRRGRTGFQVGFGYLKSALKVESNFEFHSAAANPSSYVDAFPGTGELTTVPIYVNLVNAFDLSLGETRLRGYTAVGPALLLCSVLADGTAGAGGAVADKADAFGIPVAVIDSSWAAFGAGGGAGLDLKLTARLVLSLEARFFYARRKNFAWTWTPGVYDGILGEVRDYSFDAAAAGQNGRSMTPFTVDPSFFQLSLGLKFVI